MKHRDIDFRFEGFHRGKSACHIRLATDNTKLVVVCSQYKNYYGTSVTNAIEIIAAKLLRAIWVGEYDDSNNRWSVLSKSLASAMRSDPQRSTWKMGGIVKKIAGLISADGASDSDFLLPVRHKEFFWIERYPIGTGLASHRDTYSRVTFGIGLEPSWGPTLSLMNRPGF